jgi:flavin-dependent dehydrogenase
VKEGWFWVIPFRGDRTSIGIVLEPQRIGGVPHDLDGFLATLFSESPPMRAITQGSRQVFAAEAIADFSYRVPHAGGPGWLAIGDAAGFIDPLFSTGFHLAVKGAELAAHSIVEALSSGDMSREHFQPVERAIKAATRTYIGVVQAFYQGSLVDLLFDEGKRDLMKRMITSVLAGDVFHDDPPRWLREVERRFPANLGDAGEEAALDAR